MQSAFTKPFTQQEAIPEAAIERVAEIMRTGRLHRYNTVGDELSDAAQLEAEYAAYQGAQYCVAVTSGGYACAAALRALGLMHGDKVLMNAWTLAPVPGAVHSVGGVPVMVDIGQDLRINTDDLEAKALKRGQISDAQPYARPHWQHGAHYRDLRSATASRWWKIVPIPWAPNGTARCPVILGTWQHYRKPTST